MYPRRGDVAFARYRIAEEGNHPHGEILGLAHHAENGDHPIERWAGGGVDKGGQIGLIDLLIDGGDLAPDGLAQSACHAADIDVGQRRAAVAAEVIDIEDGLVIGFNATFLPYHGVVALAE